MKKAKEFFFGDKAIDSKAIVAVSWLEIQLKRRLFCFECVETRYSVESLEAASGGNFKAVFEGILMTLNRLIEESELKSWKSFSEEARRDYQSSTAIHVLLVVIRFSSRKKFELITI